MLLFLGFPDLVSSERIKAKRRGGTYRIFHPFVVRRHVVCFIWDEEN
jgi:hypothetical protein